MDGKASTEKLPRTCKFYRDAPHDTARATAPSRGENLKRVGIVLGLPTRGTHPRNFRELQHGTQIGDDKDVPIRRGCTILSVDQLLQRVVWVKIAPWSRAHPQRTVHLSFPVLSTSASKLLAKSQRPSRQQSWKNASRPDTPS